MIVKIGLARVDIQERITIEALLDSEATELMVSTYKRPDSAYSKYKHFYKEYRKRTKFDIVREMEYDYENIVACLL